MIKKYLHIIRNFIIFKNLKWSLIGRDSCDFQKFVEIVHGAINQIKKIILLAFEFPELHKKLNYLPVYLHTKKVNNYYQLKSFKSFL